MNPVCSWSGASLDSQVVRFLLEAIVGGWTTGKTQAVDDFDQGLTDSQGYCAHIANIPQTEIT